MKLSRDEEIGQMKNCCKTVLHIHSFSKFFTYMFLKYLVVNMCEQSFWKLKKIR